MMTVDTQSCSKRVVQQEQASIDNNKCGVLSAYIKSVWGRELNRCAQWEITSTVLTPCLIVSGPLMLNFLLWPDALHGAPQTNPGFHSFLDYQFTSFGSDVALGYPVPVVCRTQCLRHWLIITVPPIGEQSIMMTDWLSVFLSVHGYISTSTRPIFTNFLCMLPRAVARSSPGSITILYVVTGYFRFYGWLHTCT